MAAVGLLHSPTSPAASEGSDLLSPGDDPDGEALNTTTEVTARLDAHDTTEPAYRSVKSAKRSSLRSAALGSGQHGVAPVLGPRPVLLVGPRFDKEYPLTHNHWVKAGRSKKAQLFCNNQAVSRKHCSFRWDRHRQVVEVKDTSMAGTLVNGETVKSDRRVLQHADRVRIEGKNMRFDFLVDLRPVGLAIADPREEQKGLNQFKKLRGPALLQRRDSLKAQLASLDAEIQKLESEAFEKEREFHDIAMRRSMRLTDDKQRQIDLEKYIAGKKVLEENLEEGRNEWVRKLEAEHAENEAQVKPLMDNIAERQTRLEKLQLKKDELERNIHPERYAVADVSRIGAYSLELPIHQKTPTAPSRESSEPPALDDIDPDEDALANLPAVQGKAAPEAASLDTGAAEEPEAKRLKVAPQED